MKNWIVWIMSAFVLGCGSLGCTNEEDVSTDGGTDGDSDVDINIYFDGDVDGDVGGDVDSESSDGCGDGTCGSGECNTCSADCNFDDCCGDNQCNNSESCASCSQDCFCVTNPVYIDPTAGPDGEGSCANPYDSWADVTFSSANDYFQKAGTTFRWSTGNTIFVLADGNSASDHIILGSYTETAGPTCTPDAPGAAVARPIIDNERSSRFIVVNASHVTVQNFEFRDGCGVIVGNGAGSPVLTSNIDDIIIQYNEISNTGTYVCDTNGNIIVGQSTTHTVSNVEIAYNIIDQNVQVDGGPGNDCIALNSNWRGLTTGAWVHHNIVDNCDHAGIAANVHDNIIEYNRINDTAGILSECLNNNGGNRNIWRYNWCNVANSIQLVTGSDNVIAFNIVDLGGENSKNDRRTAGITVMPHASGDNYVADRNLIYGNVVYNAGDDMFCMRGHTNYHATYDGQADDNEFINNVCLGGGGSDDPCLAITDNDGGIDHTTYKWYNNICYGDWDNYAEIEGDGGSPYASASAFNAAAEAQDNRDDNPLMNNPADYQFWPQIGSPLIDNGYTLSAPYDQLLDPSSDFNATPPQVSTVTQANYIGAYTLP